MNSKSRTQDLRPRAYISYSSRTKGLIPRALKLAEELRKSGIDARIDLFYAKSLHGFTPPDMPWGAWQEEQVQKANFVLVICSREYADSEPESGAWRDRRFMRADLDSGKAKPRKFIPVGFGSHEENAPFIPEFIKDATYYNLNPRARGFFFGFEDLLRRLKTEFGGASAAHPEVKTATPPKARRSTDAVAPNKSSKNDRTIVWLHLSDLHNCLPKTGWDAHRVLKPLLKDLKKMEQDHGLIPQLLFFTGDAAWGRLKGSPLKQQFDGAHELMEKARNAFSVPVSLDNVFIVPGNHDVDRAEVTPEQTSWLQDKTEAAVTDLIQKRGKQWQRYMARLTVYRSFLKRYKYDHLLSDPARLIYGQIRELHGIKMGIAGFNSAWTCGGDCEKGKLWFGGDWQLGHLLREFDADFRVALIHHPFGWFVEPEDSRLKILFEREFAFHLHGHEHLGWVDAKADGHVRVAAGACYDKANSENGYNFVRLNLDTGEGEVWLRRYDAQGGGWVPRSISGKADNNGLWGLGKLPWLQSLSRRRGN